MFNAARMTKIFVRLIVLYVVVERRFFCHLVFCFLDNIHVWYQIHYHNDVLNVKESKKSNLNFAET